MKISRQVVGVSAVIALCSVVGACVRAVEVSANVGSQYSAQLVPGIGGIGNAAVAVSAQGIVIGTGTRSDGSPSAFKFVGGVTQDIGGSATTSFAIAIDDTGAIFGAFRTKEGRLRAAVFGASEPKEVPLVGEWLVTRVVAARSPTLVAVTATSVARPLVRSFIVAFGERWEATEVGYDSQRSTFQVTSIGPDGTLVGAKSVSAGNAGGLPESEQAFVMAGGVVKELGTLGGPESEATGVNMDGVVVGWATLNKGVGHEGHWMRHAFIVSGEHNMRDLGTLGGDMSWATSIGPDGTVIGASEDSQYRQRAFYWKNGRMRDLNDLVRPDERACILSEAVGLNSRGQIAANGNLARDTSQRCAVLLSPVS